MVVTLTLTSLWLIAVRIVATLHHQGLVCIPSMDTTQSRVHTFLNPLGSFIDQFPLVKEMGDERKEGAASFFFLSNRW